MLQPDAGAGTCRDPDSFRQDCKHVRHRCSQLPVSPHGAPTTAAHGRSLSLCPHRIPPSWRVIPAQQRCCSILSRECRCNGRAPAIPPIPTASNARCGPLWYQTRCCEVIDGVLPHTEASPPGYQKLSLSSLSVQADSCTKLLPVLNLVDQGAWQPNGKHRVSVVLQMQLMMDALCSSSYFVALPGTVRVAVVDRVLSEAARKHFWSDVSRCSRADITS